jgi:hypothetical protein
MDATEVLSGITPEQLAELTDTHITTARRWKRDPKKAPPHVVRCLAVLRHGDLGAISKKWAGWGLRGDKLWSPEDDRRGFDPGHVRSVPYLEATALEMRRQVMAATATVATSQERRERIAALVTLHNAQAAAQAALEASMETLTADLTNPERNELFRALDATQQKEARHREYQKDMSEYARALEDRQEAAENGTRLHPEPGSIG